MASLVTIGLTNVQPVQEQTTTQVPISAGASGTFAATNNIATITTTSAHGLTFNPAANVLPNYYVTFGGSTSGLSGTGILVGNFFRILTIPSTTTFTIYTTITAATITSLTIIPVFYPSFVVGPGNVGGQPTLGTPAVAYPFPVLATATLNFLLGANCTVNWAPNETASSGTPLIPLDGTSTIQLGGTPATAPTTRQIAAASTANQIDMVYPWMYIAASGSAGTTYITVIR